MRADPDLASVATLIGDPARAAMLAAVLGGQALPAGELAACARISPQTASSHLAKLVAGGLLRVTTAGRHRYYQLRSPEVGAALEGTWFDRSAEYEARRRGEIPNAGDFRHPEQSSSHRFLAGKGSSPRRTAHGWLRSSIS